MLISKINSYSAIANNYKTKNVTQPAFKKILPEPKDCFQYTNQELLKKYGAHAEIVTYNEIIAMKNMAEEKSKPNGYIPNLAIAFWENEPVGAHLMAVSQDEMNSKNVQMLDLKYIITI